MNVLVQFQNNPLQFQHPRRIITCSDSRGIAAAFAEIERARGAGYYLAGFISYEAGYCFEERLDQPVIRDFPLIHMGVYDRPSAPAVQGRHQAGAYQLKGLELNITYEQYARDIRAIRDYIAQGEVYQITYCIKVTFGFSGRPIALYRQLLREQPVPYPAFIETEQFQIVSLSPEMFIKKDGAHVATKPMKGTWPRGNTIFSDRLSRLRFQYDRKNRAENVMIADLLRNDLGRVGGRIRAPRLFEVAGYTTLFQMTSTVTGQVDAQISPAALFASLFPSGSVTGAPKIRAMGIIRELEKEERKIYTGAIGYITPANDFFFSIPIRTILLQKGYGEMGIGGGIVWDSTPEGEWNEGLLKAMFLCGREFSLTRRQG